MKINQIISSTLIKETNVVDLNNYVADFIYQCKTNFSVNIIPKIHFFTHYPNTIRAMGSLIRLNMMRGDGKHQTFTRYAKRTNNYINICKTLAEKHQLEMTSNLNMNTFTDKINASKKMKPLIDDTGNFMEEFNDKIKLLTDHFGDVKKVKISSFLTVNSLYFKKGLYIIYFERLYQINALLETDGAFTFLCTHFYSTKFHKFANCIEIREGTETALIKLNEMKCKRSYESKILNGQAQIIADNLDLLPIYQKLVNNTCVKK